MTAKKIDVHTVTPKFAAPRGTFRNELMAPFAQEPVPWARHFCQRYYPRDNPDVQAVVVATEAVQDWPCLFRLNCGVVEVPNPWASADRPTLDPHPFIDYDAPKEYQNRFDDEIDRDGFVHGREEPGLGQDINQGSVAANLV